MLISELIKKLNSLKEQHGDIPVYHWDDGTFFEVTNAEYRQEEYEYFVHDIIAIGENTIKSHGSSPSELIKRLNSLKEQHGDIPVYHWDDWTFFEVTNAEYRQGGHYGDFVHDIIAIGGSPIESHGSSLSIYSEDELKMIRTALSEAGFNQIKCRFDSASIHITIIDSRFEGLTHFARSNMVEKAISTLPSEIQKDIIQLNLLSSLFEKK